MRAIGSRNRLATSFTATVIARTVLDGTFRQPGVHPPEILGAKAGLLDRVLADLRARGVRCEARVTSLGGPSG